MRSFIKSVVLLAVLLSFFWIIPSRAARNDLDAISRANLRDQNRGSIIGQATLTTSSSPLFDAVHEAYPGLNLPAKERTWKRLVRETIARNRDRIVNPDTEQLLNPAANHLEPGADLRLPAFAIVEEGDKGVGKVLVKLDPALQHDARALIRAIKATIAINQDLIRNADASELYDGSFNVIQVGDLLILPPEVMPTGSFEQPMDQPARIAESQPYTEPVELSEPTRVIERTAVTKPIDVAGTDEAVPVEAVVNETATEAEPVAIIEPIEEVATLAPVETTINQAVELDEAAAIPVAAVEKPDDSTPSGPAALTQAEEKTAPTPLTEKSYPAVSAVTFNGPIGLMPSETRVRAVPPERPGTAPGTRLLYAYLLAGFSFFGFLIILFTSWFERDRHFREQVNLMLSGALFLLTLGKLRRKSIIELPEPDGQPIASPEAKQEH